MSPAVTLLSSCRCR